MNRFQSPTLFRPRFSCQTAPLKLTRRVGRIPLFASSTERQPSWTDGVEDWEEFWTAETWEAESYLLDDEYDATRPPESPMRRAQRLMAAIKDTDMRTDIIHWLPNIEDIERYDAYEKPPTPIMPAEEDPVKSDFDVRAIVEKQRKKALLTAEWRKRQATIGRFVSIDTSVDVRLERPYYTVEPGTDKEIWDLITNKGINCDPRNHIHIVENPFESVDLVNRYGVKYKEETEEFLLRLGHLATGEMGDSLQREVVLSHSNYVDLDAIHEVDAEMYEPDE